MFRLLLFTAAAAGLAFTAGCAAGAGPAVAGSPLASGAIPASSSALRAQATARTGASGSAAVTAAAAQAFVDSVGTNVHLAYYGSAYDPRTFATLKSLIVSSGIRHLRDGMPYGQGAPVTEAQSLAASGVRFDYIMGPKSSPAQVAGWFSGLGPNVADSCEGDNEYDISHPSSVTNWPAVDVADQKTMYGVCHGLGLSVQGPSMGGQPSDAAQVGNLAAYADHANLHDYFSWRNPGTPGWGDGGYGSLPFSEQITAPEAPGKGFVSTETGYSSATTDSSYLPPEIKARYLARTFLEGFRSGVARTYAYEFADEGGAPYSGMGLVSSSLATRPAYGAVSGLLGLLADPGAAFAPGSLGYSLSGNDANLHTLLLEKQNGTFFLALWEEREEYQGDRRAYEPVAPETVTVSFASTPLLVTTHVLQDDGTYSKSAGTVVAPMTLAVDGHPTLLEIAPALPAGL